MSISPRSGFARAAACGRAALPSSATFAVQIRRRFPKVPARRGSARLAFDFLEDLTLLSSSITGTVWNDLSGSGIRQANDPGVAGATVFLDLNGDHTNDSTTVSVDATDTAITPTPGALSGFGAVGATVLVQGLPSRISDLQVNLDLVDNQPAGSAPVAVDVVSPLGLAVPDLPTLFNIQPGEHFVGSFDASATQPITLATPAADGSLTGAFQPQNSFTEPPAHIYDGNPNGTWGLVFFGNTSGIVINSWSLTFKVPEPSTTTNASGNYSLTGVAPGTYQVEVAGAPGQSQTSPAGSGSAQTVTVADGQTASGVDFGVQPASALATEKFYLSSDATAWGKPVTINYTIVNQGLGDAPAFDVAVALSSDGAFTASDPVVATLHIPAGLAAGASTTGSIMVTLPAAPPVGFTTLANTEIGFVIDPAHALTHNNPTTDANQGPGYDMSALATTPNVAVTTDSQAQNDPSIAVDPANPNHIVVAYMDNSLVNTGYAGIGISVSEDGGKTWTPGAPVPLPVGFSQGAAAPTVQFNAQGQVFIEFMAATFLGAQPGLTMPNSNQRLDGFQSNNGIFVVGSIDGGMTWSQPSAVVSHTYSGSPVYFEDDPSFAVDAYKTLPDGSPNPAFGDLYVTWVRVYPPGEFPGVPTSTGGTDIMFAVSSDGGQTWTTRTQNQGGLQVTVIKDPNYGNDGSGASGKGDMFYPQVSIGPEGDVYVSAYAAGGFDVFHSTDNGASFVAPNPAEGLGLPFPGINVLPYSTLFGDNFRTTAVRDIVADPSHPGRVYVSDANYVFDSGVGGIVDSGEILFAVSNDYGQTWDPIFQVGRENTNLANLPPGENDAFLSVLNDDDNGDFNAFDSIPQLNNAVLNGQVFPSMAVDAHGNLTVIWYDTRLDPMFQQNLDVYGTVSTDGGKTFTPNFRVTDTTFNPNNGNFTDAKGVANDYMGDHIAVAAVNGVAYAVWTTTVDGNQNIEFQSYSLATPPAPPVDRLSPDNTPQTATNLGYVSAPLSVPMLTVGAANDNWFSLTAGANGAIVVTATATAGDGANLDLELTDANGNPLALAPVVTPILNASGIVIGNQLVYEGGVAGTTYLVRVQSGDLMTIGYSLTLSALTGDLGASVSGTEAGSLPNGGLSLYRLEAAVTGSITLTLTPGNDPNDVFTLQVLSPNGQTVLASGPSAGSAASQTISLPVTAGEVVLIQVAGGDPSAASSAFTLGWTNLDQYETTGATTQFFPTPSTPSSITVADLSNNGIADIVTSSTTGSDPVSVLMGNGNGTFQAARQYDVGPGLSEALTAGYRQIGVADLTGNGVPDIIVPNFRAGDISVLLGNGDGTFQPQRTFDAAPNPDALVTGRFTSSGHADVAVLQNFPQEGGVSQLAILLGRGDGTFQPAQFYSTIFTNGAGPMVVGDFTGNGIDDILVFSKNAPEAQIFLGNGDGTFRNGGVLPLPEAVFAAQAVDLAGNGKLDLVLTGTNTGNVYVLMGNGDGSFQAAQTYAAMTPGPGDDVGVYGLAIADFGSTTSSGSSGAPDGHLDILVTAQSRTGAGAGEVIMLPGLVDKQGQFAGFGAPVVLATVATAGKIATGDFTGNGATDIAVADNGGVTVVYGETPAGQLPAIAPNTTPATARNLGSVPHLVTQPEAIVPGNQDAYFTYTVPTEAVAGSGSEVVDFSALFQDVQSAGLELAVTDASGAVNVVGNPSSTGDRFRVVAAQGDVLTIHVFGAGSGATLGVGVYTLDIDVLPQVVSVQAPPVVPGAAATSIVITLQGDRLDPSQAENPANYVVTWLGSGSGQVIPVAAAHGGPAVVYDPSANIEVSSGLSYATAVRQTITLLFATPLPAGSYEITLAPAIDAAPYSAQEGAVLVGDAALDGHSLVSVQNGYAVNGANLVVNNLVAPGSSTTGFKTIDQGSAFLTQLQGDLSALLNQYVTAGGDDPAITGNLNNEILSRLAPLFAPAPVVTGPLAPGTAPTASATPTFAVLWFDPVSIDLQAPQGGAVSYSLSSNAMTNSISQTFVQVGGNVELLVLANASGTFNLDVSNVPGAARGGEVQLSASGSSSSELTGALREGTQSFQFEFSSGEDAGGGSTSEGGGGGTVASVVSTALALLSTGAIATPVAIGTNGTNVQTEAESPEGAVEAGAATTNTATAPIPTPMPRSVTTASSSEDALAFVQGGSLDTLRPLFRSTLQFVKKVTSRVSGVINALGLGKGLISIQLLDELLDALTRPAAAGAGAQGRNEPANAPAPAARAVPAPAAAPADAEAALDVLDQILREQNVDGFVVQERNLAGPGEQDKASEVVDAYWAVAFLAAGAYHARMRNKVRHRAEPDETTISLFDANDR